MLSVVALPPFDAAQQAMLRASRPDAEFLFCGGASPEQLSAADIIIGNVRRDILPGLSRLKWLQLQNAGAQDYVREGVLPPGVLLTNATGAYGIAVAEHLLAMLLSLQKKLYLYRDNQNRALWRDEIGAPTIYGSTALIVGLGDLGWEFAKRFKLLGGYTIGVRARDASKPEYVDELYLSERLDELIPRADVIALCLPATGKTNRMIDRERLARMKPGCILVNVGRGNVIDQDALCDALESGALGAAGLEVTDPEPLPEDHRLWHAPRCIITPHIAGCMSTPLILQRLAEISAENLKAFGTGAPMRNIVDFATGYSRKA